MVRRLQAGAGRISHGCSMEQQIVDRLLTTLDVAVEAFARCRIDRGFKLMARGTAEIEVHYVLSGTLHLDVPGNEPMVCETGSIVLVPPHLRQSMGADGGAGTEMLAIDNCTPAPNGLMEFVATNGGPGDVQFVCGLISANISGSFGLLDTVRRPICEKLDDLPMIRLSFEMMQAEVQRPGLGSRALTGALMKTCVLALLRRHFGRSDHETSLLSTLRDPRLGKAVAAVLDKPAARHSAAALASIAGMSRSAFAREFSQAFAMSPMAFVARTRLHHAAGLLQSTNMPVKVIAASIGFSSRSHFSRAFRDAYGTDPSAYRRGESGAEPADDALVSARARSNGHANHDMGYAAA